MWKLSNSVLIMPRTSLIKCSLHSFKKKGSFMNPLVLAHLKKNGVAERKNNYLIIVSQKCSQQYWGEAIITAGHLINRLPTRVLDYKSPIDVLTNFFPNFSASNNFFLESLKCCFCSYSFSKHGKPGSRALRCIFVGYSSDKKDTNVSIYLLEYFPF